MIQFVMDLLSKERSRTTHDQEDEGGKETYLGNLRYMMSLEQRELERQQNGYWYLFTKVLA